MEYLNEIKNRILEFIPPSIPKEDPPITLNEAEEGVNVFEINQEKEDEEEEENYDDDDDYDDEEEEEPELYLIDKSLNSEEYRVQNNTWRSLMRTEKELTVTELEFINSLLIKVIQSPFSDGFEFDIQRLNELFMINESKKIIREKYYFSLQETQLDTNSITRFFMEGVKFNGTENTSFFKGLGNVYFLEFSILTIVTNIPNVSFEISLSLYDSTFKTWRSQPGIMMEIENESKMPIPYKINTEDIIIKNTIMKMYPLCNTNTNLLHNYKFSLIRQDIWGLFLTGNNSISSRINNNRTKKRKWTKKGKKGRRHN